MTTERSFRFRVRVPYAHVDQMSVVYYANYFVYFEMARAEMLREAGIPYGELEKQGVLLPVVAAFCDYRKPARYDELLLVISRVTLKGPRLRIDYEVRRLAAGDRNDEVPEAGAELLATGYTEHVCMSPAGKVLRPLAEFKSLLAS